MYMKYTLSLTICETEVSEKKYCNIFEMWVFIREVGKNALGTETNFLVHTPFTKKKKFYLNTLIVQSMACSIAVK